ncbi:Protein sel-13, partial [Manis javanica]
MRLPPGAQAQAAPAIGPDFEPPPRPDLRSSSSASSSLAPSYLLRSVQSGPRFRDEGDSDGSASRKVRRRGPRRGRVDPSLRLRERRT